MQLLEMEKELAGADGARAFARHDAVLAELESRIAGGMREGLAPDEYARVGQLREANLAARKILRICARECGL